MRACHYAGVDEHAMVVATTMKDAAAWVVLQLPRPRRPWISESNLVLIKRRNDARVRGAFVEERGLQKEIRASIRFDRAA